MNDRAQQPREEAVVIGACGHGLALTRALSAAGIRVLVLESDPTLPGARTKHGRIVWVPDINGPLLIDSLLHLRPQCADGERPVLYLTNDTMVRLVAENISRLRSAYMVSWENCANQVLRYLEKSSIESRCSALGLAYPKTHIIRSHFDVPLAIESIGFPMIIKPTRPLSGFKTYLPRSAKELDGFAHEHKQSLPFLAQTWIPGDDRAIYFVAQYMSHGEVLARFVGHKLRSRPMGHTTIAEPGDGADLVGYTNRFFEGLDFSGPVSLEFKRDQTGHLWVIEPTVGRTDFWIDVCVSNGINLPALEYFAQRRQPFAVDPPRLKAVWFNEDRDPFGWFWYAFVHRGALLGRRPVFLYACLSDPKPAFAHAARVIRSIPARAWNRLVRTNVGNRRNLAS